MSASHYAVPAESSGATTAQCVCVTARTSFNDPRFEKLLLVG